MSRPADGGRVAGGVDPAALAYGADGLVPVVVQEVSSGAVLMLAWADRPAVERTLATGEAHFWSRSRQRLWRKGETSGNTLSVVEARVDCDADALLLRADPRGPTCHRDTRSCFDPAPAAAGAGDLQAPPSPHLELGWLAEVVAARRDDDPAGSYTARLLAAGVERVARKVGEEATETVIAALAAAGDPAARPALAGEAADLIYHLLVLLESAGVAPAAVAAELRRRHTAPPERAAGKPEDPPPAAAGEEGGR